MPRPSRSARLIHPLLGLCFAAACGGDGGTPPIAVATVDLALATTIVLTGQTAAAVATVKDASGNVLTGRAITWSSSNTAVATVTGTAGTATITAVTPGTTTITATSEGRSGTAGLTVNAPIASVTVVLSSSAIPSNGTAQATGTPRDASGNPLAGRAITFTSSNPAVATIVATTGVITATGPGTSTITATVEGQSGTSTLTVCQVGIVPVASTAPTIYVAASTGNDATGTGSCAAPYKTITRGVAGTTSGAIVRVAPGTYDAANGEDFPILLPAGVQLIGDEANKGQGTTATRVLGGGNIAFTGSCGTFGATIYPGAKAQIAGFELTNPVGTFAEMTLLVRTDSVTIRNNSVVGNTSNTGIYLCNSSAGQAITGNRIRNNRLGLGFIFGGLNARVEGNVITLNGYGVEFDAPGGDLGGGARGSTGGNVVSCNSINDVWTNLGANVTLHLANTLWDHVSPSGNDIFNPSGALLVTTGAQVAPNNCP